MDKQKLSEIYEENARSVYKYLYCLTQNADISEELTQETFYQAAKGIESFRGECKISVWLCQIAKRAWYKELNKRKRNTISIQEVESSLISTQNVENDHLMNLSKMELFKLLHNFDEKTKEVMYLRLTGELSFSEIGEILEQSETWARVTFYRGKQRLMKGREV